MYGKDSREIYKRYLISEVSQSDLNQVNYNRQLASLPFNNIFEGKYRVILPVISDETFDLILNKIQECQAFKFDHFDFAKEKVMIELPVDEKFKHLVKGKKLRAESLNAVIAKMEQTGCITPEEAAEYSKWVIRYSGEGLRKMGDASFIILSRSPVDIVRMSDVSGIDSCHGRGGRYYHCAIAEAKQDAGFVGFLVKPEQLNKFTKEEVENNLEIFADNDRGVAGMNAFGRIRVRALAIKGREPIGVTETAIYSFSKQKNAGNTVQLPGVFSTVRRFLKQKQNLPSPEDFKQLFKDNNVKLLGGAYLDSDSVGNLVNDFYDTNHDYDGDDSANLPADRTELMERELARIHAHSGIGNALHVDAGYDVDEYNEDNPYYYANGGITIDLSEYDVDLSIFDDRYERSETQRLLRGDGVSYQKSDPDVIKFFVRLKQALRSEASIDDYEIDSVGFDHSDSKIWINLSISGEETSTSEDVDTYYTFLNTLISWDGSYDDILQAVLISLRHIGAYNAAKHEYDTDDEINDENLKHIGYDDEEGAGEIYLDTEEMFNNPELVKKYTEIKPRMDVLAQNISHYISRYIKDYFKHPSQIEVEKHPEFNFENYNPFSHFPEQSFILKVGKDYDVPCTLTRYGVNHLKFVFYTRSLNFLEFIDENYHDLSNIVRANILACLPVKDRDEVLKQNHHFYMILHAYKRYTQAFF